MTITTNNPAYGNVFFNAETLVDLRAVPSKKIQDGYSAIVAGRLNPADGFGGLYTWNALSTSADDSATVIRPDSGAASGRWLLIVGGPQNAAPAPALTNLDGTVWVHDHRVTPTTSDSDAFLAAITYANANNKGVVRFAKGQGLRPDGDYTVGTFGQNLPDGTIDPNQRGNLRSNVAITSDPGVTIWKDEAKPYVFYTNPTGVGTIPNPSTKDWTDPQGVRNLTLSGLTIRGDVVGEGFAEYHAFAHLNAVDAVSIERCTFIGTRGDAIHIGAGDIGGGTQNRHNRNVSISDCFFDGINRNNRNAISVLDCDGFRLTNCRVLNFTRTGGTAPPGDSFDINTGYPMPGAIDFEPNGFTDDPVLRNITIDGFYVDNNGGSAINLLLRSNTGIPNPLNGFRFSNVFANNCRLGIVGYIGDSNSPTSNDITLTNFRCTDSFRPFQIIGGRGVNLANGLFARCGQPGLIGYVGGEHLRDFTMTDVVFEETGNTSGVSLQVRGGVGWRWNNVQFVNANGIAVEFISTNPFTNSTFNNTSFRNDPNSPYVTTISFGVFNFGEGVPVIDSATVKESNTEYNNIRATVQSGSTQFTWAVNGSSVKAVPTVGRWVRGNTVRTYGSFEPGSPRGFYITADNALGSPVNVVTDGIIPGGPIDPTVTGLPTITRSASMATDGNGRFTASASAQSAFSTSTFAITSGQPGVQLIMRAPYSGGGGHYVGVNTLATPGNSIAGFTGIWFAEGTVYSILEGGLNQPRGSFEYGQYWRIDVIFDVTRGLPTMRIYKSADGTTWTGPIAGGGNPLNDTPGLGSSAAVRFHLIQSNPTDTIQMTKVGTP